MSGGLRQSASAFGSRNFRLFWSGALVSSIGTWMQNITVPYVLYQLTHQGLWVGLAVVAQILPSVLLAPHSGSFADRLDRRRMALVAQCTQGLLALGLWAAWEGHLRSPGLLLALVGMGGVVWMGVQPAWQALVTDLVPKEDLLNAITLNSAQANAARAVGPAIGGIVLGAFGPSWAFLLNAISFGGPVVALALIRTSRAGHQAPEGRVLQQFREAIAYSRHQRGILVAFVLTAVSGLLGYPVFQLAPLFAKRVYHVGPSLYGALTGSFGFGAILGAVALGAASARHARSRMATVATVVFSGAMIGFGLDRAFVPGLVLLGLIGAASLSVVAMVNTSIQTQVPERLRGRVLGLWIVCYNLSYPAGALGMGALADRIGPGPTVTIAGVGMGLAALWLLLRPDLARTLDERGASAAPPVGADPQPSSGDGSKVGKSRT